MSLEPIVLFQGVEILPNLTKQHTIEYLKRYCTIDDLDDSIYVKKLGNGKTTYTIDFNFGEVCVIRKIKDENGNNIEKILFENNDGYCCNDIDCDDVCTCPSCGGHLK